MGQNSSLNNTKQTKESKEIKDVAKKEYIEKKIDKITKTQNVMIEKVYDKSNTDLIDPNNDTNKTLIDLLLISEKSKTQLLRMDKNFTKADLIAIVLKLKKYNLDKINDLSLMHCSDLIILIRGLIYDVDI